MLKKRKRLNSTLKTELFEQLAGISKDTDIPMSRLLDRAVKKYLSERSAVPDSHKNNLLRLDIDEGKKEKDSVVEDLDNDSLIEKLDAQF